MLMIAYLVFTTNSYTIPRRLEQRQRVLLANYANVKNNETGARFFDSYPFNRKPKEQILRQDSRQVPDLTVTYRPRNILVIMQLRLVFSIARLIQINQEPSRFAVEYKIFHAFRKYPQRQSVLLEDLIYSLIVREYYGRDGENETKKKNNPNHHCFSSPLRVFFLLSGDLFPKPRMFLLARRRRRRHVLLTA